MVEIILVGTPVTLLHNVEGRQFWQDELQQTAPLQVNKATAGHWRHHDFVQFHLNALTAHYLDAVGHTFQGFKRLVFNLEVQLCGETYAAHHTQGVVAEGDVGVEGRGNDAILQVGQPVERVYQLAKPLFVKADGHRVNSEVAAVLVVFQRAVLNNRLARVVAVALAPGTNKFHLTVNAFIAIELYLCRSKVLEHSQMGTPPQTLLQLSGYLNAAANHHHIDVIGGPLQENITHVATHHIAFHAHCIGHLTYLVKYLLVEEYCQFLIGIKFHRIICSFCYSATKLQIIADNTKLCRKEFPKSLCLHNIIS